MLRRSRVAWRCDRKERSYGSPPEPGRGPCFKHLSPMPSEVSIPDLASSIWFAGSPSVRLLLPEIERRVWTCTLGPSRVEVDLPDPVNTPVRGQPDYRAVAALRQAGPTPEGDRGTQRRVLPPPPRVISRPLGPEPIRDHPMTCTDRAFRQGEAARA